MENELNKKKLIPKSIQGDMLETYGSNRNLKKYLNYKNLKILNTVLKKIASSNFNCAQDQFLGSSTFEFLKSILLIKSFSINFFFIFKIFKFSFS